VGLQWIGSAQQTHGSAVGFPEEHVPMLRG